MELSPDTYALFAQNHGWAWLFYQRGLKHAEQKHHSEAFGAFNAAIQSAPAWSEPYFTAAQAAFANADYIVLRALAEKGLALRPFWPQFHHLVGKSYMQEKRWADAATALLKATEQHIDVTEPNYDLAMTLVWLGSVDEAAISIGDALLFDSERVRRLQEFTDLLKARGYGKKARNWEDLARRLLP